MGRGRPKTSVDIACVCRFCGKQYTQPEHKRSGRVYCSNDCYMAGRKAGLHGRGPTKVDVTSRRDCAKCGSPMTIGGRKGRPHHTRYCSRQCARAAVRRDRLCLQCGVTFTRSGQGQPKYCSRDCMTAYQRENRKNARQKCAQCSDLFYAPSKRVYCGDPCRLEAMRDRPYPTGRAHPLYKGRGIQSNGYAWMLDPNGTRTKRGAIARRYVHVVIAERAIGRPITTSEVVHHLNGVKRDNRPENLVVMTYSEHRQVHHWYSEEYQREHDAIGDLRDKTLAFLESLRAEIEEKMAS